MSVEFFVRDPNEFLRPPAGHVLQSIELAGFYIVVKYRGEMEDGRASQVSIYLNDRGQEVIRSVTLSDPTPQPQYGPSVITPEPLAWYEKFFLYLGIHFLGRH